MTHKENGSRTGHGSKTRRATCPGTAEMKAKVIVVDISEGLIGGEDLEWAGAKLDASGILTVTNNPRCWPVFNTQHGVSLLIEGRFVQLRTIEFLDDFPCEGCANEVFSHIHEHVHRVLLDMSDFDLTLAKYPVGKETDFCERTKDI